MTDTNSTGETGPTMADSVDQAKPPALGQLDAPGEQVLWDKATATSQDLNLNPESSAGTSKATNESNSTPSNTHSENLRAAEQHLAAQQDAEQRLLKANRDLESMVLKYAKSERENLQNKMKVDELDKKLKRAIKDNDQLANRIKLLSNDKNQLSDSLSSKVAQLTVLEQKNAYLNNIQGVKLKEYEETIKRLEASNEELRKQVDSYNSKQAELLDFSERLSMKHMMLQSELDEALKKVPSYKMLHENSLRERDAAIQQREELSEQIDSLSESLTNEQKLSDSLRKALEEAERKHQAELDAHQNEVKILRRKHQMTTRELVKEIKQLQARLGECEPLKHDVEINA